MGHAIDRTYAYIRAKKFLKTAEQLRQLNDGSCLCDQRQLIEQAARDLSTAATLLEARADYMTDERQWAHNLDYIGD